MSIGADVRAKGINQMLVLDSTRHNVREKAYDQAAVISKSSLETFDTILIERSWCVFANAFVTLAQIMFLWPRRQC